MSLCVCVRVRVRVCAVSVSCVCDISSTFVYKWVCARAEALLFVGLPNLGHFSQIISQLSKLRGLSH